MDIRSADAKARPSPGHPGFAEVFGGASDGAGRLPRPPDRMVQERRRFHRIGGPHPRYTWPSPSIDPATDMPPTALQRGVCVEAAGARLAGALYLPPDPKGFVLFASSRDLMRLDRRQVDLAEALNLRGLGTLLFDLVDATDGQEAERDIGLISARLLGATGWSRRQWGVGGLPFGYIGSGLGSAAALSAAAALVPRVHAIALHGGRPDLAGAAIAAVHAPTLLLCEVEDRVEVEAARAAAAHLPGPHRIRQVGGRSEAGRWAATTAISHWMEWHLVDLHATELRDRRPA